MIFCLFYLLHLKWKSVPTVPADILNWGKILNTNKYSLKAAKLSDGQGEARNCLKYLVRGFIPGPGIYLWNTGKNHLRPGLSEKNKLVLIGTTIIWAISTLPLARSYLNSYIEFLHFTFHMAESNFRQIPEYMWAIKNKLSRLYW